MIEVSDSARYSAMTGDHIAGPPRETTDCQALIEELADGSKSLDPRWASSKSGSRPARVGDGWVSRKGTDGAYGRHIAETDGIDTRGPAYIVLDAVHSGAVTRSTALDTTDEMIEAGWYCSPDLYAAIRGKIDDLP